MRQTGKVARRFTDGLNDIAYPRLEPPGLFLIGRPNARPAYFESIVKTALTFVVRNLGQS
jgi:hypothetical protein